MLRWQIATWAPEKQRRVGQLALAFEHYEEARREESARVGRTAAAAQTRRRSIQERRKRAAEEVSSWWNTRIDGVGWFL